MPKKLLVLLASCLCLLHLCACQDARAANGQIPALNAALDMGETRRIRFTVQLPEIGKSGSGNGAESVDPPKQMDDELLQNGYVLTQVEGDSMADCLTLLAAALPRDVTFLHLRGLYFSESFAKNGPLYETLSLLLQSRLLRPGATGFLCLGRAEDVLKSTGPALGTRLSKSQDSRFQELESMSLVPYAPLSDLFSRMQSHGQDAVAVLAACNNQNALSVPVNSDQQPAQYLAGELPYKSVLPVSYLGAAVFNGTQPALFLNGYETQLLNLCLGDFEQGILNAHDTSSTHAVALEAHKPPRIHVDLTGDAPLICLSLTLEGSALSDGLVIDKSLLESRVEAQLLEDVSALLLRLQQAGCDPVDFAGRARLHALTFADWDRINWPEQYPRAKFCVTVDFILRQNAASIS